MEQQLHIALEALATSTVVKYMSKDNHIANAREGEIYLDQSKLPKCPNQVQILNALQKRIGRSDTLRSQKCTLGICVLLLLSKGYCVTSSTLSGVQDPFIERCWECVHVVSQNVPMDLSQWIQDSMESRTPTGYSVLFCNPKSSLSTVGFLRDSVSGTGEFLNVERKDLETPDVMWHRDDVIFQSMLLHMRLRDLNSS
jgi:hypothetical protein